MKGPLDEKIQQTDSLVANDSIILFQVRYVFSPDGSVFGLNFFIGQRNFRVDFSTGNKEVEFLFGRAMAIGIRPTNPPCLKFENS
jgi:hypothetical protein